MHAKSDIQLASILSNTHFVCLYTDYHFFSALMELYGAVSVHLQGGATSALFAVILPCSTSPDENLQSSQCH